MKAPFLGLVSGFVFFLGLGALTQTRAQNTNAASPTPAMRRAVVISRYGHLPITFEANAGQTNAQVKFLSRGPGYALFLTSNEALMTLKKSEAHSRGPKGAPQPDLIPLQKGEVAEGTVLRMQLAGANSEPRVEGVEELPGKSNYFIGNDPAKWRSNVPTYAKVKYAGVYPGVDVVYYGNQEQLECDFVVAAGADVTAIRLQFGGASELHVNDSGDLVIGTQDQAVRLKKPVVYQEVAGEKRLIEGSYVMASANRIGFRLGAYDHSQKLVIDPILLYSTYLGGNSYDFGESIAVDSLGNAYVTGVTGSTNFPTTAGSLQPTFTSSFREAFVTKINPSGSALVYSTYLGGSTFDRAQSIAVDASGNAYVTGYTASSDFPVVNAFQPALGGNGAYNAFVSKLNATGSALIYSTYLGGSIYDGGYGITVDASGDAYVGGFTSSNNFPTANALQPALAGASNAFIAKFNASGSALVYSTYLGGSGSDDGFAVAVDTAGNAYITGSTGSNNFPTVNALQSTYAGNGDVFVSKLNPSGSALVYSTYLGGSSGEYSFGIVADAAGNAYVVGSTQSPDFPIANALQPALAGSWDVFVTKLNASGSALLYSTYLGGSNDEYGNGIAVDASGNAYVTGYTDSTNFPLANALQTTLAGPTNVYVSMINPSGSALLYSTYLGGSGAGGDQGRAVTVDALGNAYVTGNTCSTDFPTANALQPALGGTGACNAFVAKLEQAITLLLSPTAPNQFNFGAHSFTVQYPAGTSFSGVDMTVLAAQTTPAAFEQRVAGTSFAHANCIVYSGVNGNCVDYQVTCSSTSGGAISCPSTATPSIAVKTSFDTQQQIVNPGFLTTPIGTNDWSNIFYAFYLQRIDPTVKGRTKGFSEFVAVDLGATNGQGAATLQFLWPLRPTDPRGFPTGVVIPVSFMLTSVANPGKPVTDGTAQASVVAVSDVNGNTSYIDTLEQPCRVEHIGDLYFFFLNARDYSPGTYILTVYGDAFAAQQVEFTIVHR